jgi:hypothetical protein
MAFDLPSLLGTGVETVSDIASVFLQRVFLMSEPLQGRKRRVALIKQRVGKLRW